MWAGNRTCALGGDALQPEQRHATPYVCKVVGWLFCGDVVFDWVGPDPQRKVIVAGNWWWASTHEPALSHAKIEEPVQRIKGSKERLP